MFWVLIFLYYCFQWDPMLLQMSTDRQNSLYNNLLLGLAKIFRSSYFRKQRQKRTGHVFCCISHNLLQGFIHEKRRACKALQPLLYSLPFFWETTVAILAELIYRTYSLLIFWFNYTNKLTLSLSQKYHFVCRFWCNLERQNMNTLKIFDLFLSALFQATPCSFKIIVWELPM